MRHRKAGLKLSRSTAHLNSMFRNLVTSLLKHDRIRTTDTKAKELRRWADHLVTLAKRGDLHARRQALAIVQEPGVVHKLFEKAAERFGKTAGGYTRTTKVGFRPGDNAPMTLVELVGSAEEAKKKKKPKKKAAASTSAKKQPAKAEAAAEEKPAEEKPKRKRKTDAAAEGANGEAPAEKPKKKAKPKAEKEEAAE
jgi:large subunit ribosomal protein L17